jgi:DNA primase
MDLPTAGKGGLHSGVPRVPQEIIEQVAAANDIVEVIGGYFPLKRAGGAYRALCPFHRERTPSFQVNPQRQIFKCFGCGAGGSVFRFVMDYEHIDFMAAVRKLAERANIKIPEAEMSAEDYQRADLRRRLLALHAEATEFFHTQLMRGKSADAARDYLKQRGLSAEVAKSWKIGYAPDGWDGLLNHARSEGYSGEELAGSGLFSQGEESGKIYDRFRGRIMFPICNDTGEVIAFSGRVLSAEQSPAKYVNSPETMLFTKGAVLFGLHKSKRALIEKKQAIVCEGQIDLITAFENGVQNVIAPQGTAFTERQARILKRYVDEVVLCFDADAAGEKAAERSLPYLLGGGLLVRCAEMPPGEDPDSLIRKQGGEAFAAVVGVARDFFDFQLERQARKADFATPRGRINAARKLAEFISLVPDAVTREAVLNNAATRLELGAEQLRSLLKKAAVSREEEVAAETPLRENIELDRTQEWLAVVALRDANARTWLQRQDWERLLDDGTSGSALLGTILRGQFRPEEPASLNAFIATLEPVQELTLSNVLEHKVPKDPQVIAEDCWRELLRRDLERRRQVIEARLRNPALPLEDYAALHAQVLALQQKLTALPPPRPPKPTE